MNPLSIYGQSLALLTDFYQLTMAYGYWKTKTHKKEAIFHYFFRRHPFGGSYAIAAGLEALVRFIEGFTFDASDLAYLQTLQLFEEEFLEYLSTLKLSVDVDAMQEGTLVFPFEPLVRVQGPLLECQLLETPLLNLMNFPSLIATKASRVCRAAGGDSVLEFGVRRAQGIDGALTASRSAFIGGCDATSHVLAGKVFGIPVKGTHAHSWIMSFDTELESFEAYAEALPANCVFLVDTYNTINGVKNAILAAKKLKEKGKKLLGIRLDSGELTYLSCEARKLLDEAGFCEAKIFASNELDEYLIAKLKGEGSKISVWGVGTHLVTGEDQPALDGVYKLSGVRWAGEPWQYKMKLSEKHAKISIPGILQVRRFRSGSENLEDVIYSSEHSIQKDAVGIDLLQPIFRKGSRVYELPSLVEIQKRAKEELSFLPQEMKLFKDPKIYKVTMDRSLEKLKEDLDEK